MADTDADTTENARITALEQEVCQLKLMVGKLSAAVIDTAQVSGYRIRHIKLARDALRLGFIDPLDFTPQ